MASKQLDRAVKDALQGHTPRILGALFLVGMCGSVFVYLHGQINLEKASMAMNAEESLKPYVKDAPEPVKPEVPVPVIASQELAVCRRERDDLKKKVVDVVKTHEISTNSLSRLRTELDTIGADCDRKLQAAAKKTKIPNSKLEKKLDDATKELQKIARKNLIAKYGEGKRIIIDMTTDQGPLSIEMAPTSLMPYVTWWFIDLIESGFWNGCGFVRNADHVLQANCGPKKGEKTYPSIAFQEYTPEYPHKIYTVGVAGFPGGPDWYINIVDNIANHGPGGQGVPEANPCFGKIIKGVDTVKNIHKQPRDNTGFQGLIKPVIIQKATVRAV
ncbi:hypothetical protein AAMO2058_001740700 [Amorphochlora amoebiformis]